MGLSGDAWPYWAYAMVSMSESHSPLAQMMAALEERASHERELAVSSLGFRFWSSTQPEWQSLLEERLAPILVGRQTTSSYPEVAALGFALDAEPANPSLYESVFRTGVQWMQGRQFFKPGRPWAFEVDGMSILGVALGIRSDHEDVGNSEARTWITSVVDRATNESSPDPWNLSLLLLASAVLSTSSSSLKLSSKCVPSIAAMLASKGCVDSSDVDEEGARRFILDPVEINSISSDQAFVHRQALQ